MTEKFEHYHYTPSLIAATTFAAFFFLSSVYHVIQLIKTKTWYFIPLVIGALSITPPSSFFPPHY